MDGTRTKLEDGMAIVVPSGARHNVRNVEEKPLKLYTIDGPPHHVDRTVHVTKAAAAASDEHFDGKTHGVAPFPSAAAPHEREARESGPASAWKAGPYRTSGSVRYETSGSAQPAADAPGASHPFPQSTLIA
jgi:hypothetical protein